VPFQSATFHLDKDLAAALGDQLMEAGALSVSVEDANEGTADEQPIFGEPGASTGLWQHCTLVALFDASADVTAIAHEAAAELSIDALSFVVGSVADQDWVRETQAQFQPIVISPRITIVPTWHVASNRAQDAINIVLDPGAAFGTGSHPTTQLCMRWCEANIRKGESVLDYGTGSGILAIVAKRLGSGDAIGVDIDPAAVDAARYNATQNNVEMRFETTEVALDFTADVTLANILANPLKVLAPLLASHTKPGGRLVLAGLLDEQADDLIAIYAPYFSLHAWASLEGWTCLAGDRHA
jgi:ribosomal protein L11 methyltransferase